MNRYKPHGWRNESHRHSLAARGVSTNYFARRPEARLRMRIQELNRMSEDAKSPSEKLAFQLELQRAEQALEVERGRKGLPQEVPGTFEGKPVPKEVVPQTSPESRLIDIQITRLKESERQRALNLRKEVAKRDDIIREKTEELKDLLPEDYPTASALRRKAQVLRMQQDEEGAQELQDQLDALEPRLAELAKLKKERTSMADEFDSLVGKPRKFRGKVYDEEGKLIGVAGLTKKQFKRNPDRPLPREDVLATGSTVRLSALEALEKEQAKRARGMKETKLQLSEGDKEEDRKRRALNSLTGDKIKPKKG